jgi:uncharacterized protein YjiS (DUF1127 family)
MATLVNPYRVLADSAATRTSGDSLLHRAVAWVAERRRYRRTLNELLALSDRELDDIGIGRGEIEAVARRSARVV